MDQTALHDSLDNVLDFLKVEELEGKLREREQDGTSSEVVKQLRYSSERIQHKPALILYRE